MCSTFPNISYYLSEESNCYKAVVLNGGRNVAQVLLDVYNAIPTNQEKFREQFCIEVDSWLKNDVNFKAPEIFPSIVWANAGFLMNRLFKPYKDQDWMIKCCNIYTNKV